MFDNFYIKTFCPKSLDQFAFSPSDGASGGLVTIWNSSILDGTVAQKNSYAITVKLSCKFVDKTFLVSNIYGPTNPAQKQGFITWLMNHDTTLFED
jgi:hypothetical protein